MTEAPSKIGILAALSRALDLVEGQPEGHAIRTAHIALCLAAALDLSGEEREDLAYAAILKDSGCSSNSVRINKIFGGDEHLLKRAVKVVDWSSPLESVKFAWRFTEPGRTLGAKLRRIAGSLGPPKKVMNEVTEARCTRGAEIARRLGFRSRVAETILYLDEHWDGQGAPYGRKGEEVPLLSRILSFAQTFEVFLYEFNLEEALAMAHGRSGAWFEPELVKVASSEASKHGFDLDWTDATFLGDFGPGQVLEADIDAICEAFAMIVDAKSSFTSEHSTRVTQYSLQLAEVFGYSLAQKTQLRRGALLHDIGKLGVPSGILEKNGKLDDAEFDRVRLHPRFGHEILGRIPGFDAIAEIASSHHERLDGRGYWRGLGSADLTLDVRIVSVCDVFDALSAKRPYRDALPLSEVFAILEKERVSSLDPDCVQALRELHLGESQLKAA